MEICTDPLTRFSLALIALAFLFSVGLLLIPLWFRIRQLKKIRKECFNLKPSDPTQAVRARSSMLKILAHHRWLNPSVHEYDRRWRGAYLEEYSAALGEFELSDFLNPSDVLPRIANRQIAGVIPGILVALGILGTFLGLVMVLPDLNANPHSSEIDALKELIQTVRSGLGLAFWTSILGISASIIFLFCDRMLIQRVENEIHRLSHAVATAYRTLSPDEMGRIQFGLLNNGVDTLRHLATDLAANLANVITPAFGEAVRSELAPTMQEVSTSIGRLSELMGQTQMESLRAVVEGAVGSMNTAMGEHLASLTQTIENTVGTQKELHQSLSTFREQMDFSAQRHIEMAEKTLQAAGALGSSLDRLEKIADTLGAASNQISAAAQSAEASAQAALESHTSALKAQTGLREAVEIQVIALKSSREELVSGWNAAVEQALGAIYQIQEATRQLGASIGESLVKTLETFDSSAATIVSHFSGTLSQLDASINELPSIVSDIKDAAYKIVESSNNTAVELSKLESIVSGPFMDAAQEAVTASTETTKAVESIETLVTNAASLSEQFAGSSRKLAAAADTFEAVQSQTGQLAAAIGQIEAHIPGVEHHLKSLALSLDGPLTAQIKTIEDAWNGIAPSLSRMGTLPARFDSVLDSIKEMQSGVTTNLTELSNHMDAIRARLIEGTADRTPKPGAFGGLFGRK